MNRIARFGAVTLSVVLLMIGGWLGTSQAQDPQGQVQPEEEKGQVQERAVPGLSGGAISVTPGSASPAGCAPAVKGLGPSLDAANELMALPWCGLAGDFKRFGEQPIPSTTIAENRGGGDLHWG